MNLVVIEVSNAFINSLKYDKIVVELNLEGCMAVYSKEEYYRIFDDIISIGDSHPFDCYLLLPRNNRIVRLVKKNEVFPASKLPKFSKLKKSGMFIHVDDKKIYFDYLKGKATTKEEITIVKQMEEDSNSGADQNAPEEGEYRLFPSTEVEDTEGKTDAEILDEEGIVTVEGVPDAEVDESAVLTETLLPDEIRATILQSIHQIIDKITAVKDEAIETDPEEISKIVSEHIKPDVDKVANIVSVLEDEKFQNLVTASSMLNEEYSALVNWVDSIGESAQTVKDGEHDDESLDSEALSSIDDSDFSSESSDVWNESEATKSQLVEGNVDDNNFGSDVNEKSSAWHLAQDELTVPELDKAENILSHAVIIKEIIENGEEAKTLVKEDKEKKNLYNEEKVTVVESSMMENQLSDAIEKIREILLIFNKNRNIYKTKYSNIKVSWEGLLKSLQDRLSGKEGYDSSELVRDANDFEFDAFGTDKTYHNLIIATNEACRLVQIAEGEFDQETNVNGISRVVYNVEEIETHVPPPLPESADAFELREQNRIMRLELKNAMFIMESNKVQIEELDTIMTASKTYQVQLESEVARLALAEKDVKEKADLLESTIENFNENLEDNYKNNQKYKADINMYKDEIKKLKEEMLNFEEDKRNFIEMLSSGGAGKVAVYSENDPGKTMELEEGYLEDKVNQVYEQRKELGKLQNRVNNLERKNIDLKTQVDKSLNMKRNLAGKIDKLNNDKLSVEKAKNSLDIKNKVVNTILNKTRKSLDKFQLANQRLTKEKANFMTKMYQVLEDNKRLKIKVHRTSRLAESETSEVGNIKTELESIKTKEWNKSNELNNIKGQMSQVAAENKKLKIVLTQLKTKTVDQKDTQIVDLSDKLTKEKELSTKLKKELSSAKAQLMETQELLDSMD